jgi:hypothetical protein
MNHANSDLHDALARLVKMLRERMGPGPASDLLEAHALDLAAEADREKAGQDDPAA